MKSNLPKYDPKTEARKVSGTLGESAQYQLMRLVNAGNLEAIRLVLERPKLMNAKLSDIYMFEANRIVSQANGAAK
jgi:hypothetical protein